MKRPVAREEMKKLLETGKSPLLEKFISKKGRPFSAYLVRQPDGKIGFEFEERLAKGAKGGKSTGMGKPTARVLGKHPIDDQEISILSGRYGPYIKHGSTNATLADKEKADSISLEEAIEVLHEKVGAPVKKKASTSKPAIGKTTTKAPATRRKKAA